MSSVQLFKVKHNEKDFEACVQKPISNGNGHCIILTHGAGGNMNHKSLDSLTEAVVQKGFTCVRFTCKSLNLVYRTRVFRSVLKHVHDVVKPRGYFLGGRSMGSRAAVGLANEIRDSNEPCNIMGVVCLSYPLHTEKDKSKLRDEPIQVLAFPSVFVSGDNDAMCDQDLLTETLRNCSKADIRWIPDADHSCKVKGRKEEDVFAEMNEHVITWCRAIIDSTKETETDNVLTLAREGNVKDSKRKKTSKSGKSGKKLKR